MINSSFSILLSSLFFLPVMTDKISDCAQRNGGVVWCMCDVISCRVSDYSVHSKTVVQGDGQTKPTISLDLT